MPVKPSRKEEEYFAKLEYERRKKIEEERQNKMVAQEKQKLKDLHFMKCPKCGMDLIEMEFKNIRIDRCSACEGVWLDAGELEVVSQLEKSSLGRFFSIFLD